MREGQEEVGGDGGDGKGEGGASGLRSASNWPRTRRSQLILYCTNRAPIAMYHFRVIKVLHQLLPQNGKGKQDFLYTLKK